MSDGILLGIGTNNRLYSKRDLYAPWVYIDDNNCCVKALHIMKDGVLLGVGTDNRLYTKSTLSASWQQVSSSNCCVYDIFELPNGTIVGVGTDNVLYTKTNLTSGWTRVNDSCCVISIAFLENKADIMDTLIKTWIVEPISQQTIEYRDMDENINNRNLRNYLLSL